MRPSRVASVEHVAGLSGRHRRAHRISHPDRQSSGHPADGLVRRGPHRTVGRLVAKDAVDVADFPSHLLRQPGRRRERSGHPDRGSYLCDWRIGIALTLGALLCLLSLRMFMGIVHRNDGDYEHDIGVTASRIVEYARLQPTLRAYGVLNRRELGTLEESLTRQQRSQSRLTIRGAWGLIACFGTMQLVVTTVIVLAVVLTLRGELALATMIGLLIIALRMIDPLAQLGDLAGHVQVTADAIVRVRELLAVPSLPEPGRELYLRCRHRITGRAFRLRRRRSGHQRR